jgi:hypothetical protein
MRRNVKVKSLATRVPLRKAAMSASAAARRAFPAWIDAADGTTFAAMVMPRVRSALVLRTVQKSAHPRSAGQHANGR